MIKNSSKSSIGKSGNTIQISPAKHWCFTLNNHTKEDIDNLMVCSSIQRLSMQEETGESGTPHLQGYIEFKKKLRPVGLYSFKAHWEKKKGTILQAITYTQKEDTRTGRQFLRNIRKIRLVECITNLYPWQRGVEKIVESIPSSRTVYWFWEPIGNVGKSAMVKYLCLKHQAMLISGKSADIKYQIANCKEGQYPDTILYDIPRSSEGYVNFGAIEEVKNGVFSSTKYESKMVIMPHPHLICFANFEPDLYQMSKDRWKVIRIDKSI